jgi:hypothetical protein
MSNGKWVDAEQEVLIGVDTGTGTDETAVVFIRNSAMVPDERGQVLPTNWGDPPTEKVSWKWADDLEVARDAMQQSCGISAEQLQQQPGRMTANEATLAQREITARYIERKREQIARRNIYDYLVAQLQPDYAAITRDIARGL